MSPRRYRAPSRRTLTPPGARAVRSRASNRALSPARANEVPHTGRRGIDCAPPVGCTRRDVRRGQRRQDRVRARPAWPFRHLDHGCRRMTAPATCYPCGPPTARASHGPVVSKACIGRRIPERRIPHAPLDLARSVMRRALSDGADPAAGTPWTGDHVRRSEAPDRAVAGGLGRVATGPMNSQLRCSSGSSGAVASTWTIAASTGSTSATGCLARRPQVGAEPCGDRPEVAGHRDHPEALLAALGGER